MTEATHKLLVAHVRSFCNDLAYATARVLRKLPESERAEALTFLQDQCSLYSPMTSQLIEAHLEEAK